MVTTGRVGTMASLLCRLLNAANPVRIVTSQCLRNVAAASHDVSMCPAARTMAAVGACGRPHPLPT